jgi:hypothetical protein
MSFSITLVGDSVFDNGSYTGGAPDVATHLGAILPQASRVTLCAVDGTTTLEVARQIAHIPEHTTHVVLSLGGNDALMNADLLDSPVRSTAEALDLFRARLDAFEASHRVALEAIGAARRSVTVCTIYNGNLSAIEAPRARTLLMMFNDAIVRNALARGANVIELRSVCDQPDDFANPLEPSGVGGRKIALAIARSVGIGEPHEKSMLTGG